jgi:CheY-like chemotaxis protein
MKTILIVDDEKNNLMAMKIILTSLGCKVYSAKSAEDAIELLKEIDHLDMAISDYSLGKGKDGAWLLSEIMEMYPDATRVLMSGNEQYEIEDKIPDGLVQQYEVKPLNAADFVRILGVKNDRP